MDFKFFQMDTEYWSLWSQIFDSMMTIDKDKMDDILSLFLFNLDRISLAPSASLFASREQEILNKSYHIRRLSICLLFSPMDFYLQKLPTIQSKLFEVLKGNDDLLHIEVYLCFRIILVRISPPNLSHFWPVIVFDLTSIINNCITSETTGIDSLSLLFNKLKLLDLLLVLGLEDFQYHQWLFISETTELLNDTIDKPVALIDQLGIKWNVPKITVFVI